MRPSRPTAEFAVSVIATARAMSGSRTDSAKP
jgi:hypothetical protein